MNTKIKETRDSRYPYQYELDKACFEHDIANGEFKDLNRRTAADKVLRDKKFYTVKNLRYDGYQHGLFSMTYNVFDKRLLDVVLKMRIF